jgi:hypothetical protein
MMRDDEARKSYQDFLTLWKDADSEVAIYRQAKGRVREAEQAASPQPLAASEIVRASQDESELEGESCEAATPLLAQSASSG